ncbi:MAG: lysostaphin resistance A-like protein [Agathobaculum sp.]
MMYKSRQRGDACTALLLYCAELLILYGMGRLCLAGRAYSFLRWLVPAVAAVIAWKKDRSLVLLGFGRGHLRTDAVILTAWLTVSFCIGLFVMQKPYPGIWQEACYYLFMVALCEEVLYRGFLQNYLFGLPYPKQICCLIGAGMFSASHLPFYLQVNGFHPIFLLQLSITFISHLVFCHIGEKRNNLLIPIAIHFSQDFLQMI